VERDTLRQEETIRIDSQYYYARSLIEGRDTNDDSFYIGAILPTPTSSPVYVLAVADGMGGYEHGRDIAEQALRKLTAAIFERVTIDTNLNCFPADSHLSQEFLGKVLWEAIEQAQGYIRRTIVNNHWQKAGTTIVAALVYNNTATIVNVGDSPLFHYRSSDRTLQEMTVDHSVSGGMVRGGMISPEMAAKHYLRNNLEFYIGTENFLEKSTVKHISLTPGDMLLLCSDGISGMLEIDKIAEVLKNDYLPLPTKADELFKAANNAGSTDNKTLIFWLVRE
jgi:PPM family protein phosphatase